MSTALFCVQIDYFAMNLALPRMAQDLGSSATDLQWVISIYMLSLGAFMVPAGRIGDIFGRKRALLVGIALFGVASVLCAVAPTAPMVIAVRALQGRDEVDLTPELGAILELARVRQDSYVMRQDVVRVASYYMQQWAGVVPLPTDPKPGGEG